MCGSDAATLQEKATRLEAELELIQSQLAYAKIREEGGEEIESGESYEEPDALTRVLTKWYTVPSSPSIPYRMLTEWELYPQWIPWCTGAQVLERNDDGIPSAVEVSFGIRTGPFGSVGDKVVYTVDTDPPEPGGPYRKATRVIATNNGCNYATKLQYYWTMTPVDAHGRLTKVELRLTFVAKHTWYLALWDAMRKQIVDGMATSFSARHKALMRAEAQTRFAVDPDKAKAEGATAFPGYTLKDVLQGPFRSAEAVVVTEKDGRTIRFVNEAFTQLTGFAKDEAEGQQIGSLLQACNTN